MSVIVIDTWNGFMQSLYYASKLYLRIETQKTVLALQNRGFDVIDTKL